MWTWQQAFVREAGLKAGSGGGMAGLQARTYRSWAGDQHTPASLD